MSIKEQISNRIKECMKSGNSFERDTLKTVLGEIQSKEASKGEMSEEACEKVFRKFKQGSEENLEYLKGRNISKLSTDIEDIKVRYNIEGVEKEIAIYDQYISQTMSVEEIVDFLGETAVAEDINEAKSDGQAVGIVMKFFNGNPEFGKVQGKDVTEAVKILRG